MVAIATSSGTGSEVTPFSIITDDEAHIKYSIADYAILPTMAIADADNMMDQPKGLTASSGIDVLTHAIEAYVSTLATDFTRGWSLTACKLVFEYLPRAYEFGKDDKEAREAMAHASMIAGLAFANAFLGINHSMAHKLLTLCSSETLSDTTATPLPQEWVHSLSTSGLRASKDMLRSLTTAVSLVRQTWIRLRTC